MTDLGGELHRWRIEPREYARHEERRGRRHAYERLDASTTALLVIDMVPFFVDANPYTAGIVDNIQHLADALRSCGGTIAWVVPADEAPTPARADFLGAEIAALYAASGGSGSPRERVVPALRVDNADLAVEKRSASPFFPGSSTLREQLVERDIDTILVTGTVANVCCESTVRDASGLGYRTVMVADANSAVRDEDLNASLHTVYRSFGDVRPTAELVELLRRGR